MSNSVYKARSLYRLIDDTQEFDDAELCLPHGIIVKSLQAQEANRASVVPNPARDEITLVLGGPLEETGSFILYNAMGGEVMRKEVPAQAPRVAYSINGLATGVYHFRVFNSLGLVGNGRLSIVR